MKREKMDLLEIWLPVVGGILLSSFAVSAWYGGNKILAIWLGFAGVICFMLLALFQWQEAIVEEQRSQRAGPNVDGPVVSVDRFTVDYVLDAARKVVAMGFRPIIKNNGRTAALNVVVRVNLKGGLSKLPDDFDYPDIDDGEPEPGPFVLAPDQMMAPPNFKIDMALAERIRSGAEQAFLYGWIEYDDMFEGTRRHRTEFCLRIEVVTEPMTGRPSLYFNPHGPHNCIDKGCMYAPGRKPPKEPLKPPPSAQ